jgi:hypothetical protein
MELDEDVLNFCSTGVLICYDMTRGAEPMASGRAGTVRPRCRM